VDPEEVVTAVARLTRSVAHKAIGRVDASVGG